MSAEGPVPGWADPVAAFLRANLPREHGERQGWNDLASTAFQIGCMVLVALGEANEERWGASPRIPPIRPEVPPRWDDVSVAVLWLAHQQNLLGWRLPDGGVPDRGVGMGNFVIRRIDAPPPPPPTIAAAHGGGPARATPEVMAVLAALGLVAGRAWTAAAEPVLWRCQPPEWAMAVTADPRFAVALDRCTATLPPDVRDGLARLAVISKADISAARDLHASEAAAWAARIPGGRVAPVPDDAGLRRMLVLRRGNDADWLLFRRWRLPDGWLDGMQVARALEVFHDPLARAMRRALVARLFPGTDLAAAP